MITLRPAIRHYYGKSFDVSWDAVHALRDLGSEFLLILGDDSPLSHQLEKAVLGFVQHHRMALYVVKLSVTNDLVMAKRFAIAVVPQLRWYRDGREFGRHRGGASYDMLSSLLLGKNLR